MRSSLFLCLILTSFSLFAQSERKLANGALAYYGAEFYQGRINKQSLYKILNESHSIVPGGYDIIASGCQSQQCYRHTSVGYDSARKIMFLEIFTQRDGRGTYVQDVYCGKKFYFRGIADAANMHTQVNIEHTWPQSKFSHHYNKGMQKSDMHHLYLTDSLANNRRANHEFGDSSNVDELNVQNCSGSKLTDIRGHFIFTPPPSHRGNVARSLFYFATRYNLTIGRSEELILRQWHQMDPVDAAEKVRHEIIAKYQRVRNPFVDYPQLVQKVADF